MSMPADGRDLPVARRGGEPGQVSRADAHGSGHVDPLATPAHGAFDPDDPLSSVEHWGNLTPMIGFLVVAGVILSVAAASGTGWLFVLGFVLILVWIGGFSPLATRHGGWMRW